jgi:hypothetical protein
MKFLASIAVLSFAIIICHAEDKAKADSLAPLGKCADWCLDHCKSECAKKGFGGEGVKNECKSERECVCTCPKKEAGRKLTKSNTYMLFSECTDAFCIEFCTKNANGRKFDPPTCKDKSTCQCKYQSS